MDTMTHLAHCGTFSYEFARYEQAPDDVAAKQIEERASKLVEVEE